MVENISRPNDKLFASSRKQIFRTRLCRAKNPSNVLPQGTSKIPKISSNRKDLYNKVWRVLEENVFIACN